MIPHLCTKGLAVCLASGPSLTQADVDYCRHRATVIAVNDAVLLAPWADVLYSSDRSWWRRVGLKSGYNGLKVKVANAPWKKSDKSIYPREEFGIVILRNMGEAGLELDRTSLRNYQNSGSAAINLAVHLGAKRILLLGYDMRASSKGLTHFFERSPQPIRSPYIRFRQLTKTMVEPLREAGIEVINCTPKSALDCFPMMPLREALPECDVNPLSSRICEIGTQSCETSHAITVMASDYSLVTNADGSLL